MTNGLNRFGLEKHSPLKKLNGIIKKRAPYFIIVLWRLNLSIGIKGTEKNVKEEHR